MLSEDAVFAAFRSSSIYVAASRYEPFGLAALEAALCGCAIVARDIPSLREVWGEAAVYFRDAEGLERLLGALRLPPFGHLADPTGRLRGGCGRDGFLEHQLAELASKTADHKVINALQKSWKKMTPAAHELAKTIAYGTREQELLRKALG